MTVKAKKPAPKKLVKPKSVAPKVKTPSEKLDAIGITVICEYVADGESLRSWCLSNNFNQRTVLNWIEADEERCAHYARAKQERADSVFEQLDDLCAQAVIAGSAIEVAGLRLKADTIKWKLARMNPKKYGDRTTLAGDPENPVAVLTMEQITTNPNSRIKVK